MQTKPHVIGYERASRVVSVNISGVDLSGSAFRHSRNLLLPLTLPENRARNLHTHRNGYVFLAIFLYTFALTYYLFSLNCGKINASFRINSSQYLTLRDFVISLQIRFNFSCMDMRFYILLLYYIIFLYSSLKKR